MGLFYAVILGVILTFELVRLVFRYKRTGFSCFFAFEVIYLVNYLAFPIVALTKMNAIDTLPQTKAILMLSDFEVFFNAFILYLNLIIIHLIYDHYLSKNKRAIEAGAVVYSDWESKADFAFKVANVFLVVGVFSTVLLIFGAGGIRRFLSLGQSARGLNVNISDQLGSSLTPLILLSQVLLVSPYIYYFLSKIDYKHARILFYISCLFAGVYLLFNQGKGPLLFAIIPFLLDKDRKKSLLKISSLAVISILVSPLLDALFRYITYGLWIYILDVKDFTNIFWGYYSLAFANFAYRHAISRYIGFRFGVDYINWIYLLIPNSLLKIFGFNKVGFVALVQLNTQALREISGVNFNGGLPMDYNLFNYVQLGFVTFFIAQIVLVRILAIVDSRMKYEDRYEIMRIIHYRLAIGVIMIFSSFTVESLFRSRLDIIIILFSYLYFFTYRKNKRIIIKVHM